MPIIVTGIDIPFTQKKENAIEKAVKSLMIPSSKVRSAEIYKTSLDARHHDNIKIVTSIYFELTETELEKELSEKNKNVSYYENTSLSPSFGKKKLSSPVVIAGFGPAGMFCGLTLAEFGYRPVIFERGESVDNRIKKVDNFWNNGVLDTESNVQFGEGGAGTFSDGKLTTRIKDPLCSQVLKKFVEFGAPKEILTKAKPHIGTDNLRNIVKNIRNEIEKHGGQVNFNSKIDGIKTQNNKIAGITVNNSEFKTENVVFSIGHSARDTFSMLMDSNVFVEAKPFSVGARIEHTQESVNKSLYGKLYDNPLLPQGEYQLSHRQGSHCVYTFCMCPGGFVVPSASEENTVVTNGMSEYSRNQKNANSALVVSVSPDDFGNNPLDGVEFARKIEKKAFLLGGKSYKAPATDVGSFLNYKADIRDNSVEPSYSLGVVPANYNILFPTFVTDLMRTGLNVFKRKMSCFGDKNAILTGAETRTSSPVRITRNEDLCSVSIENLYPCGEGAGYAGGIMSAAVDGIKVALKIMEKYAPLD